MVLQLLGATRVSLDNPCRLAGQDKILNSPYKAIANLVGQKGKQCPAGFGDASPWGDTTCQLSSHTTHQPDMIGRFRGEWSA